MIVSVLVRLSIFSILGVMPVGLIGCTRLRQPPASAAAAFRGSPQPATTRSPTGRYRISARQLSDEMASVSCIARAKREGQELRQEERYYDPNALGMDDLFIQECSRLGGDLEVIAQDSRQPNAANSLEGFSGVALADSSEYRPSGGRIATR